MSTAQDLVPDPILTIDDLITNATVVRSKESLHRRIISTLSAIFNDSVTKEKLVEWALTGFRPAFTVKEIDFEPPVVCSDGVKRELAEYLNFVSTPYTVSDHFSAVEACLPGIQVTYSLQSPKLLLLHVTKK